MLSIRHRDNDDDGKTTRKVCENKRVKRIARVKGQANNGGTEWRGWCEREFQENAGEKSVGLDT